MENQEITFLPSGSKSMTTRDSLCEQVRMVLFNIALSRELEARQLLMATKITPNLGTSASREYLR
jgi:hypothetical protein